MRWFWDEYRRHPLWALGLLVFFVAAVAAGSVTYVFRHPGTYNGPSVPAPIINTVIASPSHHRITHRTRPRPTVNPTLGNGQASIPGAPYSPSPSHKPTHKPTPSFSFSPPPSPTLSPTRSLSPSPIPDPSASSNAPTLESSPSPTDSSSGT